MFRYKTYKKAIIMTALVILLCLVSLAGATLALFTSDPNDGTIGIVTTSGNVEIDIVDTSNVTLQDRALAFMTTSGTTDSTSVLFEPGATFYTQGFKIQNKGNIPVNFRLSLSENDDVDMEKFKEAFEVWISTSPDNTANAQKLTDFVGRLEVGESSENTYYLFIKMKETAGNEFQGESYSGIGITVYAVQGNVEEY